MQTFLITGGCGFVGSNIAAKLLQAGERVILVDNLSRTGSPENLQWLKTLGSPEFEQLDVGEPMMLSDAIKRAAPDVVFHLAGQVAMTTSLQSPFADFRTNVVGTLNLLEAVRLHSPGTVVVYSSSNKVYGALQGVSLVEEESRYSAPDYPKGLSEKLPLDFRTPYGCSKGAADQYVLEYARTFGLKTAVFRHSTIYGSRQRSTFDQGWVGWFCMQALEQASGGVGDSFTISGDGKQVRDMLHVDDAVSCYLQAASSIEKIKGQAFNIGGGAANSSSLLELFELLENELRVSLRYRKLDWRHEDQKYFVADNTKIRSAIGWGPTVTKKEGVLNTLEWIRSCLARIAE